MVGDGWVHMASKPLDPTAIKQRLEKKKYRTSGRIGVNVATVKAEGSTSTPEGVETKHQLALEMERVEGTWQPKPPTGEEFTSAPSLLRSESNGCFTRAYIRNGEDLQRILIRLGVIAPPPVVETGRRNTWRPKRPDTSAPATGNGAQKSGTTKKGAEKQAVKKQSGAQTKTVKKTVKKVAKKTVKKAVKKTAAAKSVKMRKAAGKKSAGKRR